MAKIEVIAFVQEWRRGSSEQPDWAMKIDEVHSKGSAETGWEVVGHTYFTVKAGYEKQIDFTQFKKGDRVKVIGKQVTEVKGDYKNLIIKADSVEVLAVKGQIFQPPVPRPEVEDAPF